MATPQQIRPIAICLFSQNGAILSAEGYDPVKNETFYRPLGGGIHFGETSREALVREVREEIGAEITQLRYLGTLENLFIYDGQPGHEIVFVYDAVFVDSSLYEQAHLVGREDDGFSFKAVWKLLAELQKGLNPIYPDGLLTLLQQHNYF
jgi:8-oxo-dGTP pyrophosphatase MutT (NUDIX family)